MSLLGKSHIGVISSARGRTMDGRGSTSQKKQRQHSRFFFLPRQVRAKSKGEAGNPSPPTDFAK